MSWNRDDLRAGLIKDELIENGVVVPAALRIGEMTLVEHLAYNDMTQTRRLTQVEALLVGHRAEAVTELLNEA